MNRRRELGIVLALFLLAIATSAAFWAIVPAGFRENQSTDYLTAYEPVARAIVEGRGITQDGQIATRYPPGFSLILAGVFRLGAAAGAGDWLALYVFRLLSAGLSVVMIYLLARLVWSPVLSIVPAAAWLAYPFFLWLTKQPNSEVPFMPVLFGAFYLFWRPVLSGQRGPRAWAQLLAAGVLAGAAMLIRPAALGISLVMMLAVLLLSAREIRLTSRIGSGVLIVLGSLIPVAPWEAAVYARTGEIIPLSSGGTLTVIDGLTFLAVPKDYRREVDVPIDVAELMWSIHERRPDIAASGSMQVVMAEIARAPSAFAKLMLIKAARSWYGIDSRILERPVLLLQAVYLALVLWGSIFAWRRGGPARKMVAGNWLVTLYFWGMTLLVVPLLRYMVPVMGLLMLSLPGVYLSLAARLQWKAPMRVTDSSLDLHGSSTGSSAGNT
jgi:hypothetical protein